MSHELDASLNPPLVLAERDQPFWGFAEVFLVAALFIPALLAGLFAVQAAPGYFQTDAKKGVRELAAEFIFYAIIFAAIRLLFARHGQPLLKPLGWVRGPFKAIHLIALGIGMTFVVVLIGRLLRLPDVDVPIDELLHDPLFRVAFALFAPTLGPVVEELLFRGFLQPVLVNSTGVFPGILLTSAVFGGLHLMQYGFLWQTGVMLTFVGFVLGVIRHVSGSTRASAITHISYNLLPSLAVLFAGGSR